jgi:hypothetical protein
MSRRAYNAMAVSHTLSALPAFLLMENQSKTIEASAVCVWIGVLFWRLTPRRTTSKVLSLNPALNHTNC